MLPLSSNNYTDDTHMHRHACRDANTPRGTYASSPKPTQGTHMTLNIDRAYTQNHTTYDRKVFVYTQRYTLPKCKYRDTCRQI